MQDLMMSSFVRHLVIPVLMAGIFACFVLTLRRWERFLIYRRADIYQIDPPERWYPADVYPTGNNDQSRQAIEYREVYLYATSRLVTFASVDWLALVILSRL